MRQSIRTLLLAVLLITSVAATPLAGGLAAAQNGETTAATLAIDQPEFVDGGVRTATENGTRIYEVGHDTVELRPQNFQTEDVVSYGIDEDVGSLSYDREFDRYTLDADGNEGTFTLWWTVETERTVGNETENQTTVTETQRFEAVIRVTETASYEHYQSGELEEQRNDAANWSDVEGQIQSISGSNADVKSELDVALGLLDIRRNPADILGGGYFAALLTIVLTAGGALLFFQGTVVHYAVRLGELMRLRKVETRRADEDTLDEKLSEIEQQERDRVLNNHDWNDLPGVSDRMARALRETFGENVREGSIRLAELLRPHNLIHDRLLAMGQHGWVARVERPERTDGGDVDDDADPAPIESVELVRESTVDREALPAGVEIDDLADPSDELVEAVDWDAQALREFDLADVALDTEKMETSLRGMDFEELMRETNAARSDFETPHIFGEYVQELLISVRDHEFTDSDGRVDEVRWVLNELLNVADVEDDLFQFPLLSFAGEGVERQLIEDDPVTEARETFAAIEEGSR